MGVQPKKKFFPTKLRKTIPDSVVTFFIHLGTPVALGPARGPAGLIACCVLLLLLDTQAPPKWLHNWINRLEYYVLQLVDPSPNPNPNPNRVCTAHLLLLLDIVVERGEGQESDGYANLQERTPFGSGPMGGHPRH